MPAHDPTKFMLVTVILGIILTIAILRPKILSAETSQPQGTEKAAPVLELAAGEPHASENTPSPEEELEQRRQELDQREAALDEREAALNSRQAALDGREAGLGEGEAALGQRQAELNEREAALNSRQAELDKQEAGLKEWEATLQTWEGDLAGQDSLLDEAQARLQEKEASLAEWEQELEGRQRLSAVIAVMSGLLAVPSVVVLVVLMQQSLRTPDKGVRRVQAPKARREEWDPQHIRTIPADHVPLYGGNGRSREGVEHRR